MATATSFFVQILTNFIFTDESIIKAPKDASESDSEIRDKSPIDLLKIPSKNSITFVAKVVEPQATENQNIEMPT